MLPSPERRCPSKRPHAVSPSAMDWIHSSVMRRRLSISTLLNMKFRQARQAIPRISAWEYRSPKTARRRARAAVTRYRNTKCAIAATKQPSASAVRYGNADMGSRVSVWGSVQQMVDGLMKIVEGEAGMLMLNPVFDYMEQLDQLADEVIPRLG